MDGGGDESYDRHALLECINLGSCYIVTRAGWIMVGAHTVANNHVLDATRLADVVVVGKVGGPPNGASAEG